MEVKLHLRLYQGPCDRDLSGPGASPSARGTRSGPVLTSVYDVSRQPVCLYLTRDCRQQCWSKVEPQQKILFWVALG